jgi:hypothetical protein
MRFLDVIDHILITPYRWPDDPVVGWALGTVVVAFWAALLGALTTAVAFKANRRSLNKASGEVDQRHHQSINALKSGDKKAYRAINKLANEAFGNMFFLQIAMACAALWPVPLALAWLQSRFGDIRFPLPFSLPGIGKTVGCTFVFIPLYILVRILLGKMKHLLLRIIPGLKKPSG